MYQRINLGLNSLTLLLAMWVLSRNAAADDPAAPPALTRGPYLQLSTPSSVSIIWRTDAETQPTVQYGLDPGRLNQSLPAASILVRRVPKEGEAQGDLSLHSAPEGTVQYDAPLTGLKTGTTYYYAIGNGEMTLAGGDTEHHFRTHPVPGEVKPVRIWVVGDSGTADARQAAVYQAMRDHVTK